MAATVFGNIIRLDTTGEDTDEVLNLNGKLPVGVTVDALNVIVSMAAVSGPVSINDVAGNTIMTLEMLQNTSISLGPCKFTGGLAWVTTGSVITIILR